jgi:hypothetical protein
MTPSSLKLDGFEIEVPGTFISPKFTLNLRNVDLYFAAQVIVGG